MKVKRTCMMRIKNWKERLTKTLREPLLVTGETLSNVDNAT